MRKRLRQAGRAAAAASHHGTRLAGAILLALLLGTGALAWRLAQKPIDIPPLATRIAAAIGRDLPDLTVTVGSAGLAWEGFHHAGAPLDLRVTDIVFHRPDGGIAATISGLRVTLALPALLQGKIAPVLAAADHVSTALRPRPSQGHVSALPRLLGMLQTWLTLTPRQGALDLHDLQRVAIRDATITLHDRPDNIALAAHHATLDLRRTPRGDLAGRLHAIFHGAGGAILPLTVTADGDTTPRLHATLGPANPAAIAPDNTLLARFDLPLALDAVIRPGSADPASLTLALGPGHARIEGSPIAVSGGRVRLAVSSTAARIEDGEIALTAPDGPGPIARFSGRIGLGDPWHGQLTARLGTVSVAALKRDWPAALASAPRDFVTSRIGAGEATDGLFKATFDLGGAQGARLDTFSGHFSAQNVALTWFPNAPKLTGVAGTLVFPDRKHLRIDVTHGSLGGMTLRHGSMTIDGLDRHDQTAHLTARIDGGLGAALDVLDAPPLRLAAQGAHFPGASGHVAATINSALPLLKNLQLAQVQLSTKAQLTDVHLPLPVGNGRAPHLAVDNGRINLDAGLDHLRLNGDGTLAGAKVAFKAHMPLPNGDFVLTGKTGVTPGPAQAAALRSSFLANPQLPLDFPYRPTARDARLDLDADLAPLAAAIPPLGWHKTKNAPGQAHATIVTRGAAPPALEKLSVTAPGLAIAAHQAGDHYRIDRLSIATTTGTGTVAPPERRNAPWMVRLDLSRLDIAPLLHVSSTKGAKHVAVAKPTPHTTPASPRWQLDARIGSVILVPSAGRAGTIGPAAVTANGIGARLDALNATATLAATDPGRAGSPQAILALGRKPAGLSLHLSTNDAGRLLTALDATTAVTGGGLTLAATLPAAADAPTTGRLEMTGFRVPNAPTIGKVLEAITIYGMPEAASGKGLEIHRLTAPFTVSHGVIALHHGRAASASLGFTAAGSIDLPRKRLDLGGTVVPGTLVRGGGTLVLDDGPNPGPADGAPPRSAAPQPARTADSRTPVANATAAVAHVADHHLGEGADPPC